MHLTCESYVSIKKAKHENYIKRQNEEGKKRGTPASGTSTEVLSLTGEGGPQNVTANSAKPISSHWGEREVGLHHSRSLHLLFPLLAVPFALAIPYLANPYPSFKALPKDTSCEDFSNSTDF